MSKVKGKEFSEDEKRDFIVSTLNQAVKKKRQGGTKDAEHIRLYTALMDSQSWRLLSCAARVTYLEFLRVWWRARDKNRLEVSFSWLIKRQKIYPNTAARAYVELEVLGLIDGPKPEERGGLYGRHNIYRLSTRWQALENDKAGLKKAGEAIVAFDKKRGRTWRAKYTQARFEKLNDGAACERTPNKGLKKAKSQEAGLREW